MTLVSGLPSQGLGLHQRLHVQQFGILLRQGLGSRKYSSSCFDWVDLGHPFRDQWPLPAKNCHQKCNYQRAIFWPPTSVHKATPICISYTVSCVFRMLSTDSMIHHDCHWKEFTFDYLSLPLVCITYLMWQNSECWKGMELEGMKENWSD